MGQQINAVKAFHEMMPVFRHPRCFNCHGNFDIMSEQHEGSEVAKKSGLDPRALLTAPQRKTLHEGCGGCHDNVKGSLTRLGGTKLAGWLVAPKPMLWNGKDNEELCMQMKQFEPTGAQFVDHLETDHKVTFAPAGGALAVRAARFDAPMTGARRSPLRCTPPTAAAP